MNEQTGWTAGWTSDGNYSTLIKTTNAGQSWVNQDSSYWQGYYDLFFVNSNTGWAVGASLIKKTTNGGTNWIKLSGFDTTNYYYSVYFADANIGWVAFGKYGSNGGILKTSNGGVNWVLQFISNNSSVKSLYFLNQNTGYAAGGFSGILKTTNGGSNWNFANSTLTGVVSLCFTDVNKGWFVGVAGTNGNLGMIAKTTNGGINYEVLPTVTTYSLNCVRFIDVNTGWIVGDNGTILKTTNGGNVFVKNISKEIPKSFSLFQNYPNPFNPFTIIKYMIAENGKSPATTGAKNAKMENGVVILRVYDILGKEVTTLVNEKQSPGTYEVTFYGSQYSSGIYFYKLETGNYRESKRMILIK